MADKSISQLNAAASFDAADVFPIVHNGETVKLPGSVLFDFIPNARFIGTLQLESTIETVTTGAINPNTLLTEVSNNTGSLVTLTLATADVGTLKIITHGTMTDDVQINIPQGNGFSSITISSGKSAILFFSNGKWNNMSF